MRRIIGALFIAGGAVALFHFAVWGMSHASDPATGDPNTPFLSLGRNYPKDTLMFLGAAWGLLFGLALVVKGDPESTTGLRGASEDGGTIALFHLLNACLCASALFTAYIGAKSGADPKLVGVFFGTGLLQIGLGLILMILAAFEKPKGVIRLLLGSAVYLVAVAGGVLAFLWGVPK